MPYNSRAYRILIALPSDIEEEREIAVNVIQEWNDLYSYSRGVVLLPLRWETHSAPEYGTRPQEVINRAIVDNCDLMVGIFWTRIGTPTGVADSGTLEEIARVAKAGKPIMLYFSKVGMDPDKIDLEQLNKLKAFKAETYPNALTESYKSHIEFRDKFAKQLELKIRDLQRKDASGQPPPLTLAFASHDLKSFKGSSAQRVIVVPEVVDLDDVDGKDPDSAKQMRAAVESYVKESATTPVILAISNVGSSGIRNLYVEMDVSASIDVDITDMTPGLIRYSTFPQAVMDSDVHFITTAGNLISTTGKYHWPNVDIGRKFGPDLDEGLSKTDTGWQFSFEWPALQPQRVRLVKPTLFVTCTADARVDFTAKVFADSLPEPIRVTATLEFAIQKQQVSVKDLFRITDGGGRK